MVTFFPLVVVPLILMTVTAGIFLSREINEKIEGAYQEYQGINQLLAKDTSLINYISNLSFDMKEEAGLALDEFKITVNNYFKQSPVYQHLYFFDSQQKNLFSLSNNRAAKVADVQFFIERARSLKKGETDRLKVAPYIVLIAQSLNESEEVTGTICLFLDEAQAVGYLQNRLRSIYFTMAVIALITFITAVTLTFYISSRLSRPIRATNKILEGMARGEGDLTQRLIVQTSDEVGEMAMWFNRFVEQISNIILEVRDVSSAIIQSAEDISSKSMSLHAGTNEQTGSISDTQKILKDFSGIVAETSENSSEANSILDDFNTEIQGNRKLVENVTGTMSEINSSGQKIDSIINVINDISFQTNLLALNAAVEAARAGEAGRGFAVVAAEVRNLAQKTAESSKNIQEIVSKNVVSTKRGMALVNETSAFFASILQVVVDIIGRIDQITTSAGRQAKGVEEINRSINHIDHQVTDIVKLVEDLSGSEKNLRENADKLKKLVQMFNV